MTKADDQEFVDLALAAHTNFQRASTGLTFDEWNNKWHHIAWTFENGASNSTHTYKDNTVQLFIDGGLINTNTAYPNTVDWKTINTAMIGMYADHDSGNVDYYGEDHTNGLMDEIKIYNKALTEAEITAQWNVPATGAEDGLIAYFDFEGAYGNTKALNKVANSDSDPWNLLVGATYGGDKAAASDADGDEACRSTAGGAQTMCNPVDAVVFTASNAPLVASGADDKDIVVVAKVATATSITLTGFDADGDAITFALGVVSEGTVGTLTGATFEYTSVAVPAGGSATIAFTATAGGETATGQVTVIFAGAPIANTLSKAVVEDSDVKIILSSSDPAGLARDYIVTELPASGQLFMREGDGSVLAEIVAGDLPKTAVSSHVLFQTTPDDTTTNSFKYKVVNSLGVESAEAVITIPVTMIADTPTTQDVDVPFSSYETLLTLPVADPDTDYVSLLVRSLPKYGNLYYADAASEKSVQITEAFSPFNVEPPILQYVSRVLESGTFWADDFGNWHPDNLIGEGDAVRAHGDSGKAICFYCLQGCDEVCANGITTTLPSAVNGFFERDFVNGVKREKYATDCWDANAAYATDAYTEFFTVGFEEKVFIQSLEFGENRGMGSIVSIEAWNYETNEFVVIWDGEPDVEREAFYRETGQYSVFVPYPLCQPAFKTDIITVKMDTKTIVDWNEVDYVKMGGSLNAPKGILGVGLDEVFYEAIPTGTGCNPLSDSFTYAATDCGYLADRTTDDMTVSLVTSYVNDLPGCFEAIPDQPISALETVYDVATLFGVDSAANVLAVGDNDVATVSADKRTLTFDWTDSHDHLFLTGPIVIDFTFTNGAAVSAGSVTFLIDADLVCKPQDIELILPLATCNSASMQELTYQYKVDRLDVCIGGLEVYDMVSENCSYVPQSSSNGFVIWVMSVIGFIFSMCMAVWVFLKKKHPIIKSTQYFFALIYLVGCAGMSIQMVVFLDEATDMMCTLQYWLFNLFFTISFGALFAKTYRVYKVFNNSKLRKVRFTNADTFRVLFTLCMVDIIIMTLGTVLAPNKVVIVDMKTAHGTYPFTECQMKSNEWSMMGLAYKIVLVLIACYVSWTTKNVNSAYTESKYIMASIYQVAIYGLVVLVVASGDGAYGGKLLIVTMMAVFGTFCCVGCIFFPKIQMIMSGEFDHGVNTGGSSNATSNNTSANTSSNDGGADKEALETAEALNDQLEEEIAKMRALLKDNNIEVP